MFKIRFYLVAPLILLNILQTTSITGPTHGKVIVCYLGSWSVYRPDRGAFNIENLDPTLCTHLIYSFAGLNITSNSIKSLDPWQDLTENYGKGGYQKITGLKQRYPHLRVTLAIGGWNEGSGNYSILSKDPFRRQQFVDSAISFIRKHNFDGLDLDWEFPGKRGGQPEDKTNFLQLVKELRAGFDGYNLLLTAALGASKDTIDTAYDVRGLAQYLDFVHLMCYDYHGAWDEKSGPNAPLYSTRDSLSVQHSVDYLIEKGAPPSKIVMGIPFYGRTFNMTQLDVKKLGGAADPGGFQGPYTRENGFMGYNEICVELQNTSWQRYWDETSRTPFAVNGHRLIAYDNARSLREKVRFAIKSRNLAGLMVWSMDTDDFHGDCAAATSSNGIFENFPLLRTINRAVISHRDGGESNAVDTAPPSGEIRFIGFYISIVIITILVQ